MKIFAPGLEDSVYTIRVRATDAKKGYFEQAFVLENGRITGLDENHLSNKVHVYPNNASRKIVVKLGETDHAPVKVTLLTSNGMPVMSQEV